MEKRDVRLQIFITPDMDDKLCDIAELMGITKNELVRYSIGTLCASWKTGIDLASKEVNRQLGDGQLKGQLDISSVLKKGQKIV